MPTKIVDKKIEPQDAGRVDAFVARTLIWSRARVRGLIDHGGVVRNAAIVEDGGQKIGPGDQVVITFDPERQYREKPRERPTRGFQVAYEDEHLIVVDKEAGILTVPTPKGETNTLVDRISAYVGKGGGRTKKVAVVHRLDRETSGLLVFGRDPAVAKNIIAQFAAHKPEREYAALVAGRVARDRGTVDTHLVTDKALNQKSVVVGSRGAPTQGERAITHFRVESRFAGATLVAVNLETGRRNQIRVHFAEMGHPVLGDQRYQAERAAHANWPYDRLALHAHILGFRHPVTGRPLRFEAAMPREFQTFVRDVKTDDQ